MPSVSVSMNGELFTKINNKGISPSKAFQLGAKILIDYGINGIDVILKENEDRSKQIEDFLTINEEQKKRIENLKEELEFCRKEVLKHQNKKETPKNNREDPADKILSELKAEEG